MRTPIAGVCRFCGCTEWRPCVFREEHPGLGVLPPESQLEADLPRIYVCVWIDQDTCSSPACVERAYRAAVERTETGAR